MAFAEARIAARLRQREPAEMRRRVLSFRDPQHVIQGDEPRNRHPVFQQWPADKPRVGVEPPQVRQGDEDMTIVAGEEVRESVSGFEVGSV